MAGLWLDSGTYRLPQGVRARSSLVVANQTGITTEADLTNMTATFVADAGRLYSVKVVGMCSASVAGDRAGVRIYGGSTAYQDRIVLLGSAFVEVDADAEVLISGLPAGSITFKAALRRAGGTGTISWIASASSPAYLLVEDLGPA